MLINDYMRLPKKNQLNDSFALLVDPFSKVNRYYDDYWVINSFDGKITNIENIIIWIFTLWGFLRLIDLSRLLFFK